MKKVIAFTLYKAPTNWEKENETNHLKYINGIKSNLELASQYYPDWVVYLYHNIELDENLKNLLSEYENLELKFVDDYTVSAMQWRFLPQDDPTVELFISRDLDSRITKRESVSVNEWIQSGKKLHVMRDHPHHNYFILGGMWGMRKIENFNMSESCREWNLSKGYIFEKDWYNKWWDMNFLEEIIWPKLCNDIYENASFWCKTDYCKQFTEELDDRHFVGEIYLENGERWYHYTMI